MAALKNHRQELFCREYLKNGGNGKQACIRAGYSPRSAEVTPSYLLGIPRVAARVADLRDEAFRKQHMTESELLAGIAATARLDVRKLYDKDGTPIPVHQLDDATALAIAGIDIEERVVQSKDGDDEAIVTTRARKIRFNDRGKAQEMLSRYFNLFKADARNSADALGDAFAATLGEIIARRSGIGNLVQGSTAPALANPSESESVVRQACLQPLA